MRVPVVVVRGPAVVLRGMWNPPAPGMEPVSPALAGGLITTGPQGKSFARVLIGLFGFFFLLSCMNCLYNLEIKLFLVTSFSDTFFQSLSCLFVYGVFLMCKSL